MAHIADMILAYLALNIGSSALVLIFRKWAYVVLYFIAVSSMAGCGQPENTECQQVYSYDQQYVGAQGTTLFPSTKMHISANDVFKAYAEVEACTGIQAAGPGVTFLSFSQYGFGGGAGLYSNGNHQVLVNTDGDFRDCSTDTETLKHEYVHHLLDAAGFPWEDNKSHNSSYFGTCTK